MFVFLQLKKALKAYNNEIKEFLEHKTKTYCQPSFIETDPVSIPHNFSIKEDIEISGFLTATISWGQRKSIIRKARELMYMLDDQPYDFIMNCSDKELKSANSFVYRTFNGTDCITFLKALRNVYLNHNGLEKIFEKGFIRNKSIFEAIIYFRTVFMEIPHQKRTEKHISNPAQGSAAKRINMFLRWMVRKDDTGIDFGIWKNISPKYLYCPLDIHVGNVARKLGILNRKQNDWKAVEELTGVLKQMNADDPVRYDYGLFGLGVFEKFRSFCIDEQVPCN